jgi:hypothetical protein
MQSQILEMMRRIAATNGGAVAQRQNGGKLKDGVTLADTLFDALITDRSDPNAAQMAEQKIAQVQQRMTPEAFNELAKYVQGETNKWKAQQEYFQANPAWSTGARYGKYLVTFKRGGKVFLAGVDSEKEANNLAAGGRIIDFKRNQRDDPDIAPYMGPDTPGMLNRMRQVEENQVAILRRNGVLTTPEDVEAYMRTAPSGVIATEEAYRRGIPGLTPPPRGLTKGAEELPWLQNHFSWVHKTSNYWSRQLLRAQARAHLLDPEIAGNADLASKLATHYENLLHPDTTAGRLTQRSVMTWFMGYNPASAIVNATQPFVTHVAELTSLTGKPLDSYRRVTGAMRDIVDYWKSGKQWKDPEIAKLIHQASLDGELDFSMFDDQAAAQESIATNYKRAMSGSKIQTLGQRLSTFAGAYTTAGMWMFRGVERFNNMSALISAYKFYRESEPNLSRDEVIQKAYEFNHAVNFGGGRAQRPIGIFAGRGAFPRTAAMIGTSMQSYVLGTTFQIARYIGAGYFRPAGLKPHEVYAARIAAVQMLGTQLAAAGVLGLPFVSGALAVLNQLFPDLELNRRLRESVSGLLDSDGDNGHILSDIAMTGVPSMMGWDMQSRLSMGNTVPGVSEINGFEPEMLLGAPANLVKTFVKGGVQAFSGDPKAIDSFMPSALKKVFQLIRSGGQVLDYRNRPIFQPSLGETAGMVLGFQPKRLTDYNVASRLAKQAQDNTTRQEGQFHQQMAEEALKGNFGTVRSNLLQRTQEDKTYDWQSAARAVARATEELTFPRDLRREGTLRSSDVRSRLLSTFNLPPNAPNETQRLQFRSQIEQRLGLTATRPRDLQTAQVMDELRRRNPDAARAELRRQAALLLRGPRLQMLPTPGE